MIGKNSRFLLILVGVFSCGDSQEPYTSKFYFSNENPLQVSHANIDTTYLIAGHTTWLFERNDTIGFRVYDSLGRIQEISDLFDSFEYNYDSISRLKRIRHRDWDIYVDYHISYETRQDTVYQKIEEESGRYTHINAFRFNREGLLVWQTSDQLDQEPRNLMVHHAVDSIRASCLSEFKLSRFADYNEQGVKLKEVVLMTKGNQSPEEFSTSVFHYSNENLDSVTTNFVSLCHKNVSYFDPKGIIVKTKYDNNTTISYVHTFSKSRTIKEISTLD